jgi:hypothetical protein
MTQNSTVPGDAMVLFQTRTILGILVAGRLPVTGRYQASRKGPSIGVPTAPSAPLLTNRNYHHTSVKAQGSPLPKVRSVQRTKKRSGAKVASSSHPVVVNRRRDLEVCEAEVTWHLLRIL